MSLSGLAEELPELEASLLEDLSPRNVMRVADACRLAGEPERALELLEALVVERPTAIAPLVLIAWCQADLGRPEESQATLEDLRAVDPANPWAAGRAIPEPPVAEAPAEPETAESVEDQPAEAELIDEEPPVEDQPAEAELIDEEPPVEDQPAEAERIDEEPRVESPPAPAIPVDAEATANEQPVEELVEEPTGEEVPESGVFEISEEADLAAAVAELSAVLPAAEIEPEAVEDWETAEEESEPEPAIEAGAAPEPEAPPESEAAPEPEPPPESEAAPEPEAPPESEAAPEPEAPPEPEAEPEPEAPPEPATAWEVSPDLEPAAPPPDEEAEAEPERALTAEELADVPPSPLYSATLAEIFERQGFEEKAMEIYSEVVRTHPERVDLRERIAELERRLPGEPGQ